MKKLIQKWKSFKKIEKIQVIVTFLVAVACVVGFICLKSCYRNKPTTEEETSHLIIYDEREEPLYYGSLSTNTTYITQYNGAYSNNFGCCVCYRVPEALPYYTMPVNIYQVFHDMELELEALDLQIPQFSYRLRAVYLGYNSQPTNATLLNECTNYCNLLLNGYYTPDLQSDFIYIVDIVHDFQDNTLILPAPAGSTATLQYLFISVAFATNTTDNNILSSILPYSDTIEYDNFVYLYSADDFKFTDYQDFSYQQGYQRGKSEGKLEGANQNYSRQTGILSNLFDSIFTAPVKFVKEAFDIDFLGFNIASILLGFISVILIGWLIKKFL